MSKLDEPITQYINFNIALNNFAKLGQIKSSWGRNLCVYNLSHFWLLNFIKRNWFLKYKILESLKNNGQTTIKR